MAKTGQLLAQLAASKRKAASERLGARVGKILQRYKMGKLLRWHIEGGRLQWEWDQQKLAAEAR